MDNQENEGPPEVAIVGDLSEAASDLHEKLLGIPSNSSCILYFDSPGGSAYTAVSITNLILLRNLSATGFVTGECASAAIWPFAACCRRYVTPWSVLMFHPMKWQSEENVAIHEAAEWARHFGELETRMDVLLAELLDFAPEKLDGWMRPGRYVSGPEFAEAGLAELIEPQRFSSSVGD